MPIATVPSQALNAICPYYTMFPLSFPLRVLSRAQEGDWVLDPYCGRGTTNFAARLLRLPTVGIDGSPVAVALAQAKLADASVSQVVAAARYILRSPHSEARPRGAFWSRLYHRNTLSQLCALRAALLTDCGSDARILLRAIVLGALHGPRNVNEPSYFSNQCPRTFAPKPAYSVKFWTERELRPRKIDVLKLIRKRAKRYLTDPPNAVNGHIILGDSRQPELFRGSRRFKWVITSPPYYGMRTYIPDQWLRNWFVGGPSAVDYSNEGQLDHSSPERFVKQLGDVWTNVATICEIGAKMVVRFGGINDRKNNPLDLLQRSLEGSAWRCTTIRSAGNASQGKRQAEQFLGSAKNPISEFDLYAVLRA